MPHLSELSLTSKTRTDVKPSPESRSRDKLIARLSEQKDIAQADLNGTPVTKLKTRYQHDEATGESRAVQVPKQVRRWWWTDEAGKVFLTLRYGNKPLAIADGKASIEIGELKDLPGVLETLIEAVKAGELDKQLKAAVADRRKKLKRVS